MLLRTEVHPRLETGCSLYILYGSFHRRLDTGVVCSVYCTAEIQLWRTDSVLVLIRAGTHTVLRVHVLAGTFQPALYVIFLSMFIWHVFSKLRKVRGAKFLYTDYRYSELRVRWYWVSYVPVVLRSTELPAYVDRTGGSTTSDIRFVSLDLVGTESIRRQDPCVFVIQDSCTRHLVQNIRIHPNLFFRVLGL